MVLMSVAQGVLPVSLMVLSRKSVLNLKNTMTSSVEANALASSHQREQAEASRSEGIGSPGAIILQGPPPSAANRIPSCSGSRQSLLSPLAELDLTRDNFIIRPVHSSIVAERFCFQENCEWLELVLTLWVYEGWDLLPCQRLHCHLQLDITCLHHSQGGQHQRPITKQLLSTMQIFLPNYKVPPKPMKKENCEWLELVLTLWVYEGWDLLPCQRLHCHLQLDITCLHHSQGGQHQRQLFLMYLGVAKFNHFDDHKALIFCENIMATKAMST
ncbi:hypothetical protein HGM15179_018387 [Zosterops borbonicus]|uniref:Uncharacterized protein n=1 Tax=Zosterops borbonicus TaxID=364589 RepID=A0A8K1FZ29_9PASS|nr:hypothetical protein HGM15179_018387 [Zosterops borbonicus]